MAVSKYKRGDKVYDQEGKPAVVIDLMPYGYYEIDYGKGLHGGGFEDEDLTPRTEPAPVDEETPIKLNNKKGRF